VNDHRLNVNGNSHGDNSNGLAFGIALVSKAFNMKTYNNLYSKIISLENLYLAYRKAKKGKTKKQYVTDFEANLKENLLLLQSELIFHIYLPKPLKIFILCDPKTRKISKSNFRDRIVHHALCNIIEPIFEKTFIFDSYANRKGKGTLAALNRLDEFKRKVSRNGKTKGWFNNNQVRGYCLKADIKHYFETIHHGILLSIIKKKIKCTRTLWLIKRILANYSTKEGDVGMPLGNLTSQFFANVYLNELDKFVKHYFRAKYYIRYVDDFLILHFSKEKLEQWKNEINSFLQKKLKIELHETKSRVIPLNRQIPFIGFRVFYYYKLLKKFNRKNINRKLENFRILFSKNKISYDKIYISMIGAFAYMKHANTYKFRKNVSKKMENIFANQISHVETSKYIQNSM